MRSGMEGKCRGPEAPIPPPAFRERMNSPLETREVRLRGLGGQGSARVGDAFVWRVRAPLGGDDAAQDGRHRNSGECVSA